MSGSRVAVLDSRTESRADFQENCGLPRKKAEGKVTFRPFSSECQASQGLEMAQFPSLIYANLKGFRRHFERFFEDFWPILAKKRNSSEIDHDDPQLRDC